MTVRFDDDARTVILSVRDLVERAAPSGDLRVDLAQRSTTRLAQGRDAHTRWQRMREREEESYRAEVAVRLTLEVLGWDVTLTGRVDGVCQDQGVQVVEEVKTSLLEGERLCRTGLEDWSSHVEQLQAYLWMWSRKERGEAVGRLVLLSLLDGTRHVLQVDASPQAVEDWVFHRLRTLVGDRSSRLTWIRERREVDVCPPFVEWRPGQESMADVVQWNLDAGQDVLVQAPTGFGKTAPILTGALRHALAHGKQVFWATARTTHQGLVMDTVNHLVARGVPVRGLRLGSKERVCLNDAVVCRGDACPFASGYWDKIREGQLIERVLSLGAPGLQGIATLAQETEVCPFELTLDASDRVDVLVGDYNYVFDPAVRLRRHFGDTAKGWVVVVDEAHHLLERARAWRSPSVDVGRARAAVARMRDIDEVRYAPFITLAEDIEASVEAVIRRAGPPGQDGLARVELPDDWLAHEADRIDALAIAYLKVELQTGAYLRPERDPWLDLARGVLQFRQQSDDVEGVARVTVASRSQGRVGWLCVDVSGWIGTQIGRLGGMVGCSATLSPTGFYKDVLGLPAERTDVLEQGDQVAPDRRRVFIAPYVSTMFKDRAAHAPQTSELLESCIEAVPGNVAVYFPSFAMMEELTDRWRLEGRHVMRQPRKLLASERDAWLAQLHTTEGHVVLAAVLGGVFAEGIDLPPGSLDAVFVTGPALPPVGLERDLLKEHYEATFEQGHRYASLIPGLTKVVQAAGRLHRRPTDRGAILLVGRRFRWRDVRSLLPDSWYAEVVEDPVASLRDFYTEEA